MNARYERRWARNLFLFCQKQVHVWLAVWWSEGVNDKYRRLHNSDEFFIHSCISKHDSLRWNLAMDHVSATVAQTHTDKRLSDATGHINIDLACSNVNILLDNLIAMPFRCLILYMRTSGVFGWYSQRLLIPSIATSSPQLVNSNAYKTNKMCTLHSAYHI